MVRWTQDEIDILKRESTASSPVLIGAQWDKADTCKRVVIWKSVHRRFINGCGSETRESWGTYVKAMRLGLVGGQLGKPAMVRHLDCSSACKHKGSQKKRKTKSITPRKNKRKKTQQNKLRFPNRRLATHLTLYQPSLFAMLCHDALARAMSINRQLSLIKHVVVEPLSDYSIDDILGIVEAYDQDAYLLNGDDDASINVMLKKLGFNNNGLKRKELRRWRNRIMSELHPDKQSGNSEETKVRCVNAFTVFSKSNIQDSLWKIINNK